MSVIIVAAASSIVIVTTLYFWQQTHSYSRYFLWEFKARQLICGNKIQGWINTAITHRKFHRTSLQHTLLFEDSQSSLICTMSSCALIKHCYCYHGFHISTFPCLMNPAPTLDPGRAPCCGVIHAWLRGLANGCRPCSLFSIASIHNLSTCGCILITLLSVLQFLHLDRRIPGRPWFAASLSDLRGLSAG